MLFGTDEQSYPDLYVCCDLRGEFVLFNVSVSRKMKMPFTVQNRPPTRRGDVINIYLGRRYV